jgi:hypothetical protein
MADRFNHHEEEGGSHLQRGCAAGDTERLVEVTCEHCGGTASFSAREQGAVQRCPCCRAFLDVGEATEEGSPGRSGGIPSAPSRVGQRFEHVRFATPEEVRTRLKPYAFSDQGWLEVSPGAIRFSGGEVQFEIRTVKSVSLTRQPAPWLLLALLNVLVLLVSLDHYYSVDSSRRTAVIVAAIGMLVLVNLVMPGRKTRQWVRVEFTDAAGQPEEAYFADGWYPVPGGKWGLCGRSLVLAAIRFSRTVDRLRQRFGLDPADPEGRARQEDSTDTPCLGWGGVLGGTSRLYEAIRKHMHGEC